MHTQSRRSTSQASIKIDDECTEGFRHVCGGGARAHAPQSAARKGMSRLFQRPASATQPSRRGAGQSPSARPSRAPSPEGRYTRPSASSSTVHIQRLPRRLASCLTQGSLLRTARPEGSQCEAEKVAVRGGKGRSARRASSQCEAEEVAVRGRRGRSARPGGRSAKPRGSHCVGNKVALRSSGLALRPSCATRGPRTAEELCECVGWCYCVGWCSDPSYAEHGSSCVPS